VAVLVDIHAPTLKVVLDGVEPPTDVVGSISSVTVVAEPDALDHARLAIANPYPDMPFTDGREAGRFEEGGSLVIRLDYDRATSTLFDGEITGLSPTFPSSGVPTFTVEAYNRLHRLTTPHRSETHNDVTDADLAAKIAQRNQLAIAATPTSTMHTALVQHHQNDLEFLRGRARALGYEIRVEGKTLYFQPRSYAPGPELRLAWGNVGTGDYPIESLEVRLNARAPVSSVQVRAQDPESRELLLGTATATDQDTLGGGVRAATIVGQAFGPSELVLVEEPVLSQEEARTTARAILNDRAQSLVMASGTTAGIPTLRPGVVVGIAGIGRRFSGNYYITRVTHTLSSSGYTTSFAAATNVVERPL
jgi:phage protein D